MGVGAVCCNGEGGESLFAVGLFRDFSSENRFFPQYSDIEKCDIFTVGEEVATELINEGR